MAATAAVVIHKARRLLVGGLLIELGARDFEQFAQKAKSPVVTGTIGWWHKQRIYFLVKGGLTFYCKVPLDKHLPLSVLEVEEINTGPLSL